MRMPMMLRPDLVRCDLGWPDMAGHTLGLAPLGVEALDGDDYEHGD